MNDYLDYFPFLALYAETHFRFFRYFPSLIYKKQPEILFDMPRRIAPNKNIPIILMLNDIDQFPVEILNLTIVLSQNGSSRIFLSENDISSYIVKHPFDFQSKVYLFDLPCNLLSPGNFFINGKLTIKQKGKVSVIVNDNFATSSKSALRGMIVKDIFPGQELCIYGDMHFHSQYSRSHVEFGPPISVIDTMASAYGLDFLCITDHSYDLSCKMENYLEPDNKLYTWKSFLKSFHKSGKDKFKTTIIPGEEISVLNRKNKTVHLGACGISEFIPGSNDGARKFKLSSDLHISEAVKNVKNQGGISFAAHPGAKTGFLQKIFLNRGNWSSSDINKYLNAFQAVNSGFHNSWYSARKMWIKTLLKKNKIPLIAGNDAHGDFNRYRSIGKPFVNIYENFEKYMGHSRTGIYSKYSSKSDILDTIRSGKTFITTGPYLTISASSNPEDSIISHSKNDIQSVFIIGKSNDEFGKINILRIFRGYYNRAKENLLRSLKYNDPTFSLTEKIEIDIDNGDGYIRAELTCMKENGIKTMASTSPCYFTNS